MANTPGAEFYRVSPDPAELVVTKRRYSGFLGTELAERLSQSGVSWVVVAGLTTECCVDATACDAFQLDLPVLLPADATAAYDQAMHDHALDALAENVAVVTSVDELVAAWRSEPDP
jgi:nicotinamidase-related amidase